MPPVALYSTHATSQVTSCMHLQVSFLLLRCAGPVALFVDLRVRDAFGNANNCMVEVDVVDKIRPTIWCPEDITVQWACHTSQRRRTPFT